MDAARQDESQAQPLAGIVVIDLTQIYQGPYCTFLMAKAGAEVIKIEPLLGEPSRIRAKVGGGASLPMAMLNVNKKGITLNLKTDKGKALFKQLIKKPISWLKTSPLG